MIAFLIYLFVLWLAWRLLCRWTSSHDVQIVPAPPTQVAVFTPSITIHIHLDRVTIAAVRRQKEGIGK